jgi:hypothetical protein
MVMSWVAPGWIARRLHHPDRQPGAGEGEGLVDLGPAYLRKIAPYDINGNTGAAAEMTDTPNGGVIIRATCSN